jgi:transposase
MSTNPTQPRKRRSYTKEFKESALKLADEIGSTKAGADLGVDPSVIRNWRRERRQQGEDAFRGHGNRTTLEAELARLCRQNIVLKQDREILKKRRNSS